MMSMLVVSTAVSGPAWSWGLDGHRTVGMVADILLATDPASVASKKLLGDASLSEAATWADCAKGFCGALTKDERRWRRRAGADADRPPCAPAPIVRTCDRERPGHYSAPFRAGRLRSAY